MSDKYSILVEFLASTNIEKISGELENSLKNIQRTAQDLNKVLEDSDASFKSIERRVKRITTVVGAGFAAAFGGSIHEFNKFDAALQDLSALTGLEGESLDYLGKEALRLSKIYGDAADSILVSNKRVGSNISDLLPFPDLLSKVTEDSLILARAQSMDVVDAIEAVTLSMNQYKLKAEDTRMVIDTLAAGAKLGAAEVSDVAQTLAKAGVVLNEANIDFYESNALVQVLAQNALSGAWAGTQLRSSILSLTSKGIDQFNPAVVGLNKALENLATSELTAEEKLSLFGKEAITAAEIMIRERDRIALWTESFKQQGIAVEQASKNLDTNRVKIFQLGSSIKATAISIGKKLQPATMALLSSLTRFFEWIDDHLGVLKNLAIVTGLVVAAMWAFILPTKILIGLKAAATVLDLVKAMWAFNVAVYANPVVAIVAAIIAVIGALTYVVYKYWDVIKPALVDVWEKAKEAFGPALMLLWEGLKSIWEVAKPVLSFIAKVVGTVIVSAFLGFLKVLEWVLTAINALMKPLNWIIDKIRIVLGQKKELNDMKTETPEFFNPAALKKSESRGVISPINSQSLDISMSIDSQGRPSVDAVDSSSDVNFDVDIGLMAPVF